LYALSLVKGQIPTLDEDGDIQAQKEYLSKKYGVVWLDDTYEEFLVRVWANSIVNNGFGSFVDTARVFAYADRYKLDRVELLEDIEYIKRVVDAKRSKDNPKS